MFQIRETYHGVRLTFPDIRPLSQQISKRYKNEFRPMSQPDGKFSLNDHKQAVKKLQNALEKLKALQSAKRHAPNLPPLPKK